MAGFEVPEPSSSTPSTPDNRQNARTQTFFASLASNPSTTPAGPPPPSSAGSFTPAGPPPSSIFGSTPSGLPEYDRSKPLFGSSYATDPGPVPISFKAPPGQSSSPADSTKPFGSLKTRAPPSSPPQADAESDDDDEPPTAEDEEQDDGDEGAGASDDDETEDEGQSSDGEADLADGEQDDGGPEGEMDEEEDDDEDDGEPLNLSSGRRITRPHHLPGLADSSPVSLPFDPAGSQQSSADPTKNKDPSQRPPAEFDSHSIPEQRFRSSLINAPHSMLIGNGSAISSIARDLASRIGPATLHESDRVILGTEELMSRMFRSHDQVDALPDKAVISTTVEDLVRLWRSAHLDAAADPDDSDGRLVGVGPPGSAPLMAKATFLGSLMLELHHPPILKASNTFSLTRANQSLGFSQSFNARAAGRHLPMSKVLFDWLDTYHNPLPSALIDLAAQYPNPTRPANFWDIILSSVLRGKLDEVIRLLRKADFQFAAPSFDDIPNISDLGRSGPPKTYTSTQVGNIHRVVSRAVQVLEQCPAISAGDWDIRGSDWTIFRLRVAQAAEDLMMFAEGSDRDATREATPFAAEHFGLPAQQANPFLDDRRGKEGREQDPVDHLPEPQGHVRPAHGRRD